MWCKGIENVLLRGSFCRHLKSHLLVVLGWAAWPVWVKEGNAGIPVSHLLCVNSGEYQWPVCCLWNHSCKSRHRGIGWLFKSAVLIVFLIMYRLFIITVHVWHYTERRSFPWVIVPSQLSHVQKQTSASFTFTWWQDTVTAVLHKPIVHWTHWSSQGVYLDWHAHHLSLCQWVDTLPFS